MRSTADQLTFIQISEVTVLCTQTVLNCLFVADSLLFVCSVILGMVKFRNEIRIKCAFGKEDKDEVTTALEEPVDASDVAEHVPEAVRRSVVLVYFVVQRNVNYKVALVFIDIVVQIRVNALNAIEGILSCGTLRSKN